MIDKEDLVEFLRKTIRKAPFRGCKYIELGNGLSVVMACCSDEDYGDRLWCKIAKRAGEGFKDYDHDWQLVDGKLYERDDCLELSKAEIGFTADDILEIAR